jgi:hypothetical protein
MKLKFGFTLVLLFLFSLIVLPLEAQQRKVRRLGTNDAFNRAVLRSEADFRNFVRTRKGDIDVVLQKYGWGGNILDLARAGETGNVTVEAIQPGAELPFMAMRQRGKPDLIRQVVWAGTSPVEVYVMEFESNERTYRFYAPKVCSNFWIEEVKREAPEVARAVITLQGADVCVTQPASVRVTVEGAPAGATIQFTVDGQGAGSIPAASGEKQIGPYSEPGTHTVTATLTGSSPVSATVNVRSCAPVCVLTVTPSGELKRGDTFIVDASGSKADPAISGGLKSVNVEIIRDGETVETFELTPPDLQREVKAGKGGIYTVRGTAIDAIGQTSSAGCEATLTVAQGAPLFFVAGFVGKERLLQEIEGTSLVAANCDPIVGFEFGVLPMIADNVAVELSVGGKINTDDSDNSSIYADVAVDGVFSRGFLGAGVSFWDLTEEDTRSVALLVHGGFNLDDDGRIQLVIEGRGPFEELDDLGNNYVLWGGIRFRFGD